MKKLKESTKIILGMAVGLVLSTASYVLAQTLINSKDVVYEDNSNLMADNVQDAIDGTCSKIDTRLSDIEDKLYTVKKINGSKVFTSSNTTLSYTGLSIELPAKSYCSITLNSSYTYGYATTLMLTDSATAGFSSRVASNTLGKPDDSNVGPEVLNWSISVSYSTYTEKATTIYAWAKYTDVGNNTLYYDGFCATKYKQ